MPARRRHFPWLLLLVTGAVLWAMLALSQGLALDDGLPFSVVIDGQDLSAGLGAHRLDAGTRLLLAVAAVLAGLWLLVAVPLALLAILGLALGVLVLAVLGSVGLPLLAVGLVLGLLALPLLLLVWLLRWMIT